MRRSKLLLFAFVTVFTGFFAAALLVPIEAQDGAATPALSAGTCAAVLEQLWTDASTACINKPVGYICNGGAPPAAEPSGVISGALAPVGALIEVGAVDAIRTPPIMTENNSLGIAWMRLPDPLNVTALLVGDVTLFDVTPPDIAPWTSIILQASTTAPSCASAPASVLILQSSGQTRLAINGVSLVFNGSILVTTDDTRTIFIGLSGQTTVLALSQQQNLPPGEQVTVAHAPGSVASASGAPTVATPFDPAFMRNLPVPLFDYPMILPQPGYASTLGAVNLRNAPDVYSGVITQVAGGQPLTILGRNPDNTWYHVRLQTGETGWILAELLAQNIGSIDAVYVETPLPPQRLGELGTRGRIRAPAGVNLRRGPDTQYASVGNLGDGTLVDLLARSPYQNGWVKVQANGINGWLSLLTLDTQAYIDALPVDYSIPPLPTATPIPGSFGNAFPDPDQGG